MAGTGVTLYGLKLNATEQRFVIAGSVSSAALRKVTGEFIATLDASGNVEWSDMTEGDALVDFYAGFAPNDDLVVGVNYSEDSGAVWLSGIFTDWHRLGQLWLFIPRTW